MDKEEYVLPPAKKVWLEVGRYAFRIEHEPNGSAVLEVYLLDNIEGEPFHEFKLPPRRA